MSLILPSLDFTEILPLQTATVSSMNAADYWLMAREYSIWNAAVASLQFWTEDLNPVTLGRATEHVYTTFIYSRMRHTLHLQSNETLFGCFVIALNAAFDQQLLLADEGYKSGSDTINLPTPLRKTPHIHHVSSMEHTSFNPVLTTSHSTPQTLPRPVHRCLSFSSADSYTPDSTPLCSNSSEDEEEDFRQYLWMMNTGLLKKHLKEHYVFMNMAYHMDYTSTHVLMQTMKLSPIWTVWI